MKMVTNQCLPLTHPYHIVSLFSSGLYKYLLIELIINGFICPPTIDLTFSMISLNKPIEYSLDSIVAVVCVFRFQNVFRLFEHYSHWTSERSKRVW
jgi:hypothetical protein